VSGAAAPDPATCDQACVAFLQQVLPQLGLRWPGFRKVRRQVCKRLARRRKALDLADLDAYRAYLAAHPEELAVVDALCRISISRFYRDRAVWDRLYATVLPERAAARRDGTLRCWSAGCASGEEPYSLALCWHLDLAARCPGVTLEILATDADARLLDRARAACYPSGCLKELPRDWLPRAFERRDRVYCLRPALRAGVTLACQDLRRAMPDGPFDLILCRNLAFTYFDAAGQAAAARRLAQRLVPGGALVLGRRETLPDAVTALRRPDPDLPIYRASAA
jgi:chemotaxis protein methyltransferase CheR